LEQLVQREEQERQVHLDFKEELVQQDLLDQLDEQAQQV
jgi:hypothetical protein